MTEGSTDQGDFASKERLGHPRKVFRVPEDHGLPKAPTFAAWVLTMDRLGKDFVCIKLSNR